MMSHFMQVWQIYVDRLTRRVKKYSFRVKYKEIQ